MEAPAVWLELYGLVVRPKISEMVSMARRPVGTAVFTWIRAPESWRRRTIDDEVGMGRPTLREKPIVESWPLMSTVSGGPWFVSPKKNRQDEAREYLLY